jgi:hypothetical protein
LGGGWVRGGGKFLTRDAPLHGGCTGGCLKSI